MNNTRFATAIHIMTLLAESPQDWLTSEWIAGSININPVIVRKELCFKRDGFNYKQTGKRRRESVGKECRFYTNF